MDLLTILTIAGVVISGIGLILQIVSMVNGGFEGGFQLVLFPILLVVVVVGVWYLFTGPTSGMINFDSPTNTFMTVVVIAVIIIITIAGLAGRLD